jgi:hypothetical protein
MKDISRRIMEYSRMALTLLVLSVLVSAVGGSVEQVAADLDTVAGIAVPRGSGESMQAVEKQPVPEVEGPARNMNRDGRAPLPVHSQHLTPGILPLPDKTDSRVRQAPVQPSTETACPVPAVSEERTQTTPWLIDPHLGRQFTLVGARPSGTS